MSGDWVRAHDVSTGDLVADAVFAPECRKAEFTKRLTGFMRKMSAAVGKGAAVVFTVSATEKGRMIEEIIVEANERGFFNMTGKAGTTIRVGGMQLDFMDDWDCGFDQGWEDALAGVWARDVPWEASKRGTDWAAGYAQGFKDAQVRNPRRRWWLARLWRRWAG